MDESKHVPRRDDLVVFLDFDGVIRIGEYDDTGFKSRFCQDKMKALATVVGRTGAQIVVTSDWRNASNREEISGFLEPHLHMFLHKDWGTPICGHRWNEVERWLNVHPEVENYVILEDFAPHFEGCPDEMHKRILLCSNRFGLVQHQLIAVEALLKGHAVAMPR